MTEKTGWARLRQDIAEEVTRQIEKTSHTELTGRTDALAEKLAAVTLALVEADGALAQRVKKLESLAMSAPYPWPAGPSRRKSWWRWIFSGGSGPYE